MLRKTLSITYGEMHLATPIDMQNQSVLEVLSGQLGSVTTTTFNGIPCWKDIETTRSIILGVPPHRESRVEFDPTKTNTINIRCTDYYKQTTGTDNIATEFGSDVEQFCPDGIIKLTPLGGDQWRMEIDYDYRSVSAEQLEFFDRKFGTANEEMEFLFNDETLFACPFKPYTRYREFKDFAWDQQTPLSFVLKEARSTDTEDEFAQDVEFRLY